MGAGEVMNAIVQTLKTVFGLFVDDGSLAFTIITLLVCVAMFSQSPLIRSPLALMALLVGGTVALLLENVIRAARVRR
jgi:hypothetical protein